MKKTGLRHVISLFSANALQIFFSQLGSLFLFWLSSKELSKTDFGQFNWYFAVCGTAMAILTFGFDFVVIKRISAKNEVEAARLQFFQNLLICCLSIIPIFLAMAFNFSSPLFKELLFVLVAFQFTYLSLPFKNALTGKELFSYSAKTVVISNSVKIALILFFYFTHSMTLLHVSLVLAFSNLVELVTYMVISFNVFERRWLLQKPYFAGYKHILKESLPQLGVIVFDSAFARVDWILLGIISASNAALNTAEYSFAYKVFEISRLPLLVLAPLLFTRFSKLLHNPSLMNTEIKSGIYSFLKLELIIGMLVPLLLNLAWVPLMLSFTSGKYGPENQHIYLLLSLTLPVDYMVNFLWTLAFAQGQLKLTMTFSMINATLNILLNLVLIPRLGQTGAAISYLVCNLVLFPMYFMKVNQSHFKFPLKMPCQVIALAAVTGIIAYLLPLAFPVKWAIALLLYGSAIFLFRIFSVEELKKIRFFISRA